MPTRIAALATKSRVIYSYELIGFCFVDFLEKDLGMDIPDSFILHKEKFPTVILECDAILHILSHKNNLTALSLAIYTWLAYTNCPLSLEEISIALNQSNLDVAAAIKNLKSLELI